MFIKVKYCYGNQHSSRSGISFSSLTLIIMKFGQVTHYTVVAFSCQEHTSVPLYRFSLNVVFLGLGLHPRDFRPNLSLLWLDLLHFACTRESLNLRWQNTKVRNSETESATRKTNGYSAALCSLGLSSGGKKPQLALCDKSQYVFDEHANFNCMSYSISKLSYAVSACQVDLIPWKNKRWMRRNENKVYLLSIFFCNTYVLDIFQA